MQAPPVPMHAYEGTTNAEYPYITLHTVVQSSTCIYTIACMGHIVKPAIKLNIDPIKLSPCVKIVNCIDVHSMHTRQHNDMQQYNHNGKHM